MVKNKEDFFNTVIYNENPNQRVINYLEARGFLLSHSPNSLKMSDNGHQNDSAAANQLLKKYDIGFVDDNDFIILEHPDNADLLKELFVEGQQISFSVCYGDDHWGNFRCWKHGRKVPVMDLEPYVARYIKAISACGVDTDYSCDGNHKGKNLIIIGCHGRYNAIFHQYIQEDFISDKFRLPWNETYSVVHFSPDTQFDCYIKLNMAAEYLYKYRFEFRSLKYTLAKSITHKKAKRASNGELLQLFRDIYAASNN